MSGEAELDDGTERLRGIVELRGRRAWQFLAQLVLGITLGFAILAALLGGIDYRTVGTILASADGGWLASAVAVVLVTTFAKIGRWRMLFPREQRPGLYVLGRALLVGQLTNFAIPLRAGGLVRAYIVGAERAAGGAMALATIAAEKAFDVLFLLILAGIVSVLVPLPAWLTASLGALAFAGLALLVFALAVPTTRVLAHVQRFAGRMPRGLGERLVAATQSGLAGLGALRDPRMALAVCGWTAVIWTMATTTNVLVFRALGMSLGTGAALLQLLVHMTPTPGTPGHIGVHQGLTVAGLAPYQIGAPAQIAYAATLYAVVYIPQVLLGIVSLALTVANTKWTKSRDLRDCSGV